MQKIFHLSDTFTVYLDSWMYVEDWIKHVLVVTYNGLPVAVQKLGIVTREGQPVMPCTVLKLISFEDACENINSSSFFVFKRKSILKL